MHWRNGEHGYGVVTKLLHWLTVLAIVAQFVIGYTMDPDAAVDRAEERLDAVEDRRDRLGDEQGEPAEERFEAEVERREEALESLEPSGPELLGDVVTGTAFGDGLTGFETHVAIGLTLIALGLTRLLWRRTTRLPPWAVHLSAGERALESRLEKALLALLLAVPGSGLLLLLGSDELLPLHIAAQVTLLATVAVHVALVLKHTVARRNGHLSRML